MTNAHSFGGRAHTREEKAKKTYHDTDFLWFDCQASTVINVDTQLNEYAGIICSLFSSRSRSSSGRSQSCYCCFCCGCWSYCCWSCRSNYKHLDMLSERVVHALVSLRLWVWPSLWSSLQHGDFNCQRINVSTFIVAFEVCHRCVRFSLYFIALLLTYKCHYDIRAYRYRSSHLPPYISFLWPK